MSKPGGAREVRGVVAVLAAAGATIALVLVGLVAVPHLRPLSSHTQADDGQLLPSSPVAASPAPASPTVPSSAIAAPPQAATSPLSLQSVDAILSAIPSHLPTTKKPTPSTTAKPKPSTSASDSPSPPASTIASAIPPTEASVVIVNATSFEISVFVDGSNTVVASGATSSPMAFTPSPGVDKVWVKSVPFPQCGNEPDGTYHLMPTQEYKMEITSIAGCSVGGTDEGVPITVGAVFTPVS